MGFHSVQVIVLVHPFQRFIDSAVDAMLVADAEGRILAANPAAAQIFGCGVLELRTAMIEDLLPERYRAPHREQRAEFLERARRRGMGEGRVVRAQRRDGAEFDAAVSLAPLEDGCVLATIVDVTQRRHESEALRKFSRVIEQTASSIIITDLNGVIEYVNPSFARTTGYTAAEAIGRRPSMLKSGHTSQEEYRQLWLTITGGNVWYGEFHNKRKDGSLYWESAIISPIRDDRGQVTHFAAVKDDITTRKAAHAALREREEQLRLLVEHAPAALAMLDNDMRYVVVSARWLADYGLSGANLVGRSHYEVFPEIGERWRAINRRCLAGGIERAEEDRFERADGTVQWLRWEVRPWHAASGAIGGIVIFTEDISEHVRARHAVEQSEQRFRATFEQAAVGLAHVAPDGRWLRANRKLCTILGYRCDEFMERSFSEITHPADLDIDAAPMQRLLAGAIAYYSVDKRFLRRDGTPTWIRATVSLLRAADGSPDYFIWVIEDIDERKRTEHALRLIRSEMDQMLALHVASQTTAAIAHDLNQPLNAVAAYSEAAMRMLRAGNANPERLLYALQASADQAQRAGRVVRELLDFLHRGETTAQRFDLNAVVHEALAIIEANALGGFHTALDLAPDLRPVRANRLQVEKVLVNLLRNSIEAMNTGGLAPHSVTITVRTAAQEEMAQVTVSDTGPGLDAATVRRLFEPFFTTKANGLGMGLSISRALIEANGGRLWVEEREGPGATFHFTLPFDK